MGRNSEAVEFGKAEKRGKVESRDGKVVAKFASTPFNT
jgi:hypothetical protein